MEEYWNGFYRGKGTKLTKKLTLKVSGDDPTPRPDISSVHGFEIKSFVTNPETAAPGSPVTFKSETKGYWEFCSLKKGDKIVCDFEYSKEKDAIVKTQYQTGTDEQCQFVGKLWGNCDIKRANVSNTDAGQFSSPHVVTKLTFCLFCLNFLFLLLCGGFCKTALWLH